MRPVVVAAAVDIQASPEDVFDYCSDLSREPEWNPMMARSDKLTEGAIRHGTRYAAQFAKGPRMVMECTRYERPSAWSYVGTSSSLNARGYGHIEPTPGGTHLHMGMELEPHGVLKLAGPLVRRRVQPLFEQDLLNIKARMES